MLLSHVDKIYDVLVSDGADEDSRIAFRFWFFNPNQREWRFIGSLGFGGKFIKERDRYFTTCYPEDVNAERVATIERLNKALAELKAGEEE
jgi:hypothetical protein